MARKSKPRHAATLQPAPRPFLTIAEAAGIACCNRRTVHRWLEAGLVESSRPIAAGSSRRLIYRVSFYQFLGLALGEMATEQPVQ